MASFPALILASSSPYKRDLLGRLGLPFRAVSPELDERRGPGESPLKMARRLAADKADALTDAFPEAAILGSDQVIALGDRIFGKPGTAQRAVEQLGALQGRTHQLITAVQLRMPDGSHHRAEASYQMQMRSLNPDQIRAYVDEDHPLDCAGAYRIEKAGIRLFEATRGDDPTAIEGLPLISVWSILLAAGFHDE